MSKKLQWKVHTVELFKDIAANPECSMHRIPLNILQNLLAQVAQRATELHDPILDRLMIRLTLYSVANPNEADYDAEIVVQILEKAEK